jgi:hypothetical protein
MYFTYRSSLLFRVVISTHIGCRMATWDTLYEFPTGNTLPFNIQIPVDQVRGHQQLISRKNLDLFL